MDVSRACFTFYTVALHEQIRLQDERANKWRKELKQVLRSQASGAAPTIAEYPRGTVWRIEEHLFHHGGACFSRGMSELFLFSREVHDCMWSDKTHLYGTSQAKWVWQSRGEVDINLPNFICYGMLCTSTVHFDFRQLPGRLIHPVDGTYPFYPFRDCAIAYMKARNQRVVYRPRLCYRD